MSDPAHFRRGARAAGLWLLLAVSCGRSAPPPASAHPAEVQNPTPEAALTTVTLTADAERRLGIETVAAKEETLAGTRTVGGEVMAPPGRAVVVSAPIAGTIDVQGALALAGSRVAEGQVVLSVLPLSASDRNLRIEAERAAQESEVRLTAAGQRLQRLERLLQEGSASVRSVEEARAEDATARAQQEASGAQLAAVALLPLGSRGELTVRAPFGGVILAVHAAAGQTVAPSAPLFEIADLSEVWIRVPLYVGDLDGLEADRPSSVAALGQTAPAHWRPARRVAGPPSANASAASADLFLALSNPDGALRPGARVAVRLPITGSERGLVVPGSALLYDLNGGTWVYEARAPHVFVRRRVEVRGETAELVLIGRGLEAGTEVVTAGAAELYGTEFGAGK